MERLIAHIDQDGSLLALRGLPQQQTGETQTVVADPNQPMPPEDHPEMTTAAGGIIGVMALAGLGLAMLNHRYRRPTPRSTQQ